MAAPKKNSNSKKTAAPAPKAAVEVVPAPKAAPAPVMARSVSVATTPVVETKRSRVPTHDEIRIRAYQIYAGRGHTNGNPDADWREAERQLRSEM